MKNIHIIQKEDGMNVPVVVYASEKLYDSIKKDKTIEQIKNVAKLPGILKWAIAMPDAHQGYGFPIGGVAAFDLESGVISPGGVGYDINCGVRLLKTNLFVDDISDIQKVTHELNRAVPSGVGRGSKINLTEADLDEILVNGVEWCFKKNFATKEDLENCEDSGKIEGACVSCVSKKARKRGKGQLGTLGAGNHFLEVQKVEEIFNEETSKIFGLKKNQICIMIHCGSRGLGHQVASDYIHEMEEKIGIENLPDRELVNAPIGSELGKKYFGAMAAAANFAFANRQMITFFVRDSLKRIFPEIEIGLVYDVAHNIAKIERHEFDGKKKLLVMRKGATRAFGPGREELPEIYKTTGQPILIPGSMGTASYVLVGTKKSEELSWASTAHGAGRSMSRMKAKHTLSLSDLKKDLEKKGIFVEAGSKEGMLEEAPQAYKDIDEVVRVSDELEIGKLVAKLVPLGVVKG